MSQKKSNPYTAEFKEAAVKLAVESDQPVAQTARELGVNVNTQHTSNSFQGLLKQHKFRCSMSRKGNCWDNAPSESFFHTLKTELVYHKDLKTREEAKQAIFEYIEVFYNRERLHSSNDYMSPADCESKLRAAA